MRHRVYGKHLGRNKDERDNLFRGLIQTLFTHGTIQISETRAKAIKGLVDKVIKFAKDKEEGRLQAFLTDKSLRERLIKDIVPKLGARTSGFTSIVKIGTRAGDQTMMVRMSLIGAEELKPIVIESSRKNQELSKKSEELKSEIKNAPKRSVKTKITKPERGGKKA